MRTVQKGLATFLVMLTLIGILPISAVLAKTDNPYEQTVGHATFSVSTSFCAAGESTKVFIDISKDSELSAGLFLLTYDTSLIRARGVETGLVLKNGTTSKNICQDGTVKVSYADVNPNYDAGRLFEVEFEAIGTVPDGQEYIDVPITLIIEDLRNYEDYKIASTVINGKITLIDTPYGDVNFSGDVTATDALMALYANAQLVDLNKEQNTVADVNGDGKVSAADALLILQYSAGDISNYPLFTMEAPGGLSVTEKDETYVKLSWDASKNVIGYNVYMDGVKQNATPITGTSYTVNGLVQDTRHAFALTAVNSLTESVPCAALEVSTNKAERNVTFKDWDGTILNNQIVLSGESVVLPADPTRTGYTFTGWDGDTAHITTDAVFTAQYGINTYAVSFDYLYNDASASTSAVYLTGISAPRLISRNEYTLEGWYRDKNFTRKWDFANDLVEGDLTLYAHWVTWSVWTTDAALSNDDRYIVQSKTQYAYSDKETTTSTSTSLSGWTKVSSTPSSYTEYGNWSGWTASYVSGSNTRQVETKQVVTGYNKKTVYKYSRWRWDNGKAAWGVRSGDCIYYEETNWLDAPLEHQVNHSCGPGYGYKYPNANGTVYPIYWYNEITDLVDNYNSPIYGTQYRYRDRSPIYSYYKWSAYSEWSDSVYTASDTRQVKTQTVYRYLLKQQ